MNWSGRSSSRGQRDNQHSLSVGRDIRTDDLFRHIHLSASKKQRPKIIEL